MEKLILKLKAENPDITFKSSDTFCWFAEKRLITYKITGNNSDTWSLLHELGHAKLAHSNYRSDADLLQKELAAWDMAFELGAQQSIKIDSDHAEDCLDSYRDWLHKRSSCPHCTAQGIQEDSGHYICLNCDYQWSVTRERLCRAYRRSK